MARAGDLTDEPPRWQALFRWLAQVNDAAATVTQADVDAVKAAGWSESALVDAATVCSAFNLFNRWVDAAGVPDVPGNWYDRHMAVHGRLDYTI